MFSFYEGQIWFQTSKYYSLQLSLKLSLIHSNDPFFFIKLSLSLYSGLTLLLQLRRITLAAEINLVRPRANADLEILVTQDVQPKRQIWAECWMIIILNIVLTEHLLLQWLKSIPCCSDTVVSSFNAEHKCIPFMKLCVVMINSTFIPNSPFMLFAQIKRFG